MTIAVNRWSRHGSRVLITAALTQRPRVRIPLKPRKTFFRAIFAIAYIAIHCDGHILISFVFPQFTSFHSVFHSFHGLMNSINWPASSIWVFIAQLGEHCSANAEATGSNPVEAPKNFFSGYFRNCLYCDSLRWSHTHFNCYIRALIPLTSVFG